MLAADDTRNRRQVDDRPAAIGDHGRDRVLDAKEHPGGVNRHDPMPGFGAVEVLFGAARDAGIVDQHVEFAEMAGSGSHDGGPTPFLGDIELLEPRRDTNTIGYLPTFVFQYVRNHYLGAFACEHARRGGSHAGCRAGDDGDLASESHRYPPPLSGASSLSPGRALKEVAATRAETVFGITVVLGPGVSLAPEDAI